ncbi:MAG TPA: TPM domain-containing protein [Candidatus Paceibacterota bacterium]|nr:TPM domain-containing protein [Candidatus Paceibacterota bacterium]
MRPRSSSRVFGWFLCAAVLLPVLTLAYSSPGEPRGFVNDFAGVLGEAERSALEKEITDLKAATGAEIAVVTVKSLGGDTVENYANELFADWGIGQKNKDNGVLFLVAIDDRVMRIEVGYGLEGVLTDAQAYWIEQNVVVPAFRDGNYYLGIEGAVRKIIGAIGAGEKIPSISPKETGIANFDFSEIFWLVLVVPIWLASVLGRSRSWWLGGVLGGIGGLIIGFFFGFLYTGIISFIILVPLGLFFDFLVSRAYERGKSTGHYPWWIGGGRGIGGRSGWGGFGGGHSGGGGASSRW